MTQATLFDAPGAPCPRCFRVHPRENWQHPGDCPHCKKEPLMAPCASYCLTCWLKVRDGIDLTPEAREALLKDE